MKLLPLAPKILCLIRYILSQFLTSFEKSCKGAAAPPRDRNTVFQKMRFWWVQIHIKIFKIIGPIFTGFVSPNAGGIDVERVTHRF